MTSDVVFSELAIVDIDDPQNKHVLTTPMPKVKFPLSKNELHFIDALKEKVRQLGAAGLAATQLGVAKPITAFQVSEEALQWREDITELVPLTVLINPSYEPIEALGKSLDWEGCFSAKNHYGKIMRYAAIKYRGQDVHGNIVEGEAFGFLARLLQHEIDHCHNTMCIDRYDENYPHGAQDELLPTRKAELAKRKQELGLKPEDNFPLAKKP